MAEKQPADMVERSKRRSHAPERFFTDGTAHPLDLVPWVRHSVRVEDADGSVAFEQVDVEAPQHWSTRAVSSVAHRYFHGRMGSPERETSVRQLISRVVSSLVEWGQEGRYLRTPAIAETFEHELTHLLVHQLATFNSPVWFNLGHEGEPQCSACIINSVEDSMASILELAKTEGMLFKHGSGAGSNLSTLRSSREALSGGGTAAGPVAFMHGFDAFASVIKSGGRPRPAGKMVILDVNHPDIVDFIRCRAEEQRRARSLPGAGGHGLEEGLEPRHSHSANLSVRVGDGFMQAVEEGGWWETRAVTTDQVVARYRARDVVREMADAAWTCNHPSVQYDSTINRWNTCARSGRINASNPCCEYLFLDDTACTLASLNLLKFIDHDGRFQVEGFCRAVDLVVLALEIMVGFARYPTERVAANTREFRPIGLGFANLGALLDALGHGYGSDTGRAVAAAITSLMTGRAYLQSARIAASMGSFAAYPINREPMLAVITRHRDAAQRLPCEGVPADLRREAAAVWNAALRLGTRSGYRNAQVSAIAPTGSTHLMMDCVTPGAEPPGNGVDTPPEDQLRMIAALQPFLSGGVAKRITLSWEVGPEEIERLFMLGWRAGLKSLAVLRQAPDPARQAMSARADAHLGTCSELPARRRLPSQPSSLTHRFSVAGQEVLVTVGLYEDGTPGEMSISLSPSGSVLAGFLDAFAGGVSATLQNGVPLESLVRSFARARPESACWSTSPHVPRAESVVDHVLRWMAAQFLPADRLQAAGVPPLETDAADQSDAALELN